VAKYKLLTQHYSEEDKLLEPDTLVGDGTPHLWTRRPTAEMEPLDDEGRALIDKERVRAQEMGITWGRIAPIDDLPMTGEEANKKYEADVKSVQAVLAARNAR
jgi:hypothetical protein